MSSRKKHIVEMQKTLETRVAELQARETEVVQHIKNISKEIMVDVRSLLQEPDKKKFLKNYPAVSSRLDRSLTRLMLLRANLPSLDSEESSSDTETDGQTVGSRTCGAPTIGDRTDESAAENSGWSVHDGSVTSAGSVAGSVCGTQCTSPEPKTSMVTAKVRESSTPSSFPPQPKQSGSTKLLSSSQGSVESVGPAPGLGSQHAVPTPESANATSSGNKLTTQQDVPSKGAGQPPLSKTPREILPLVLQEGLKFEVVVSEVVSPYIFWIQRVHSSIDKLMWEIGHYYSNASRLPALIPKVGMYCCACFTEDDNWYRARVIAIHLHPSSDGKAEETCMVDIIYMDYGNRERIPNSRLRPLHPRFMKIPAKAVCCRLSKVKPKDTKGPHWSAEETKFFRQLVQRCSPLMATVVHPAEGGQSLASIDLAYIQQINESEFREVDLAKFMIAHHQAISESQPIDHTHATPVTDHAQKPEAIEKEACQSQNAPQTAPPESETSTPVPETSEPQNATETEGKDPDDKVDKSGVSSSSGKKKKKKKKTKKSRRSQELEASSEGTDVPPSTSPGTLANQIYESEPSGQECEPHPRTTETSCSEAGVKNKKLKLPALSKETVTQVAADSRQMPGKDDAASTGGNHQASCGSESPRSCSPTSTSGVSSAMSSTYFPQKQPLDAKHAITSGRSAHQGEFSPGDARRKFEQRKHPARESCKLTTEDSCSADPTEQFFTCAEDGSEAESVGPVITKPHSPEPSQPSPPRPVQKTPVIREIGKKYPEQRSLCAGDQIQFAISHVVSPGKFYIHAIGSELKLMDTLTEDLNNFYSGIKSSGRQERPLRWPVVGDICCAKFSVDNCWYRGTITDIQDKKGICVWYVDFGEEEWLAQELVLPLDKSFTTLPPLVFTCRMARIQPTMEQGDNDKAGVESPGWSVESTKGLVEMCGFQKLLTGQVVESPTSDGVTELVVTDSSDGGDVCINQKMVDLGLATSSFYHKTVVEDNEENSGKPLHLQAGLEVEEGSSHSGHKGGSVDGKPPLAAKEEILDEWNPMMQHFRSEVNSYGVDMDDLGVATTGVKSNYSERVCKYAAVGKFCYKGQSCPFEHPRPGQRYVDYTHAFWCNETVVLPEPKSWVAVEVTAIQSPVHFWVQLPFGSKPLDLVQREWSSMDQSSDERKEDGETLTALLDSINEIYSKPYRRTEDLSLLALGETVCAQFTKDSLWYRARVTDVDAENNKVKVFFVDYGNSEWLSRSRVRPAMPQFLHLPFQAVECFLAGVELVAPDDQQREGSEARKLFEELTTDKPLVAYIVSSNEDALYVELYDTTTPRQVCIAESLADAGYVCLSSCHDQQQKCGKAPGKAPPVAPVSPPGR
ncbi:uncharacterized protein [Diadema antillarum]|uniref:uncharacterized protein n=1 Tax=Diadema antillarum TaxID=105358 RepID=UPI003A89F725